jgi:Na+-translocating ferredoxin:NAD+ oxidoreductase RnfD subunit
VLKRGPKHVFNPTNFGIVAMMFLTSQVWVSPAQWGSQLYFGFLITCAGGIVIYRAARSDVTYAFLLAHVGILFGRAFWLGDPWTIPFKQLQSGSLLLFAFYMISDPKTTPDSRIGRFGFAILVAAGAAYVQFGLYRTNGLLWSLAFCSILTPIIDRLLPGTRYEWNRHSLSKGLKGEIRETNHLIPDRTAHPVGQSRAGAQFLRLLRRQG